MNAGTLAVLAVAFFVWQDSKKPKSPGFGFTGLSEGEREDLWKRITGGDDYRKAISEAPQNVIDQINSYIESTDNAVSSLGNLWDTLAGTVSNIGSGFNHQQSGNGPLE